MSAKEILQAHFYKWVKEIEIVEGDLKSVRQIGSLLVLTFGNDNRYWLKLEKTSPATLDDLGTN